MANLWPSPKPRNLKATASIYLKMNITGPAPTEKQSIAGFFFEDSPLSYHSVANSQLFRLPLELRDRVYDHLWIDTQIQESREVCAFTVAYGCVHDKKQNTDDKLPGWLLACKPMLAEGIAQFYRKARCVRHVLHEDGIQREGHCFRLLALQRIRAIDYRYVRRDCVLDVAVDLNGDGALSIARHNRVSMINHAKKWLDDREYGEAGSWAVVVPNYNQLGRPRSYPNLEAIIDYMSCRNNSVKDVTLKFGLPRVLLPQRRLLGTVNDDITTWHIDFSFLKNLGTSLDRVKVSFHAPPYWLPWIEQPRFDEVFVHIQSEMAEVAKYLVGGMHGGSWKLRDWLMKDHHPYLGGMPEWHLEITRSAGQTSFGSIVNRGTSGFGQGEVLLSLEGQTY
ncbi:hypothetical protein BDV95DRAFT_571624 [Massariosphaeria phaeospora]|uniref:Uncharacterized protein n=1 Tax=Massariosphaeria phaeospora TaxID=100035 RepID=A0A7C8MCP7_9PLEO|nr:hypothetical protein BDV95DRAFT_571624 [Massariosphaeria phaeospora]